MWWWVWSVAALMFLIAEIHTQAFYALFIVLGAAVAAIADVLGLPLWAQAILGIGASMLGIVLVRPLLWNWMEKHRSHLQLAGGSTSLVGGEAMTVDAVGDDNHSGHVVLEGITWLACVAPGVPPLPANMRVVVMAVRGTTLVVQPVGQPPAALGY